MPDAVGWSYSICPGAEGYDRICLRAALVCEHPALLSYNIQAAAGYEFNKVIGARLAINAWQSKAGLKFYPNTGDNSLDALKGDYKWKWNYIAPTVDITFNLSNLISGVNPKRVFSVGAFAGIGANIAWGNSEAADVNRTLKPALGYAYNSHGVTARQLT